MIERTAPPPRWRTSGGWFGPPERPCFGWATVPTRGEARGGVLILPPLGYEYVTAHRTLRTLAEQLAERGCTALRIDYDGTGDSAGEQWDNDRLAAWRASVANGVEALQRMGHDDVCLVGLRVGASLALLEAAHLGVARVVGWAPVVSGRRYVRELRMLGLAAPPTARPALAGALSLGGFAFTADTLNELAGIDLDRLEARPAADVMLIERPDGPALAGAAEHLTRLGSDVELRAIDGTQLCLDQPAEYATVPHGIVREICAWVSKTQSPPRSMPADADGGMRDQVELSAESARITERVASFGPNDLVGIAGSGSGPPRATVVWANSGSETHIGAGRAWVEYSRALNRAGFRSVRLDCRGWGESPDDARAARPYDAHMATDLRDVVTDIEARGWGPVVLAGLCAGAWMALDVARTTHLDGVVALNPQLYWQPGDPVEASMTETHARREGERQRLKLLDRCGLWWLLDRLGVRDPAARCLEDVAERGTPTLLLFANGDDGLEFLEDRNRGALARAKRGRATVVELSGIDHGMHRVWLRHEVIDATLEFLEATFPVDPSVDR